MSEGTASLTDIRPGHAEKVQALCLEEVNAAARSLIDPAALTWVVAGDRALLEGQGRLRELGELHVIDADDPSLFG